MAAIDDLHRDMDQSVDVHVALGNEGILDIFSGPFMLYSLLNTPMIPDDCIQFPERLPALCKKCCKGPSDEEVLAASMASNNNSAPSQVSDAGDGIDHCALSSGSIATNDSFSNEGMKNIPSWSRRTSSRHSVVIANTKRPDDVLSFYADVECSIHLLFIFGCEYSI